MNDHHSATSQISRERAATLGRETVAILDAEHCVTDTGVRVDIREVDRNPFREASRKPLTS